MICPKCGREYLGSSCPYCESPEVIVNNQDYLQRKMEYEKKQAELKSASSSHARADAGDGASPDELRPDEVFKKILDRAKQDGSEAGERTKKAAVSGEHRINVKSVRRIFVVLVLLTVAVMCTVVVVNLVKRNNQTLFTRYNGRIYNVSGIDSEYVCDYDKAYFQTDGKNFYVPDEPADVTGKVVTEKLASDGGRYFASEVYDENASKYTLYLWNSDNCYKLSENSSKKNIMYLSDDGDIVYKETVMVNDEGGMGAASLYVSQVIDNGGLMAVTTQLSDALRSACVYSDKKLVIYNTTDDVLYSFYYGKNKTMSTIQTDVTAIYPAVSGRSGYYSYRSSQTNTDDNVTAFVYISDKCAWYIDLADKNAQGSVIDSVTGTTGEYIIENNDIYAITSGSVRHASYKNGQAGTYSDIAALGNTANVEYFPDKDTIIAVDAAGKLISINKGNVKNLDTDVTEGTLYAVNNSDYGITYVKNGVQYYYNTLTGRQMVITESDDGTSVADTLVYKNRLYYYNSIGKLCSCTLSGKDDKLIGDVEKFWLGR